MRFPIGYNKKKTGEKYWTEITSKREVMFAISYKQFMNTQVAPEGGGQGCALQSLSYTVKLYPPLLDWWRNFILKSAFLYCCHESISGTPTGKTLAIHHAAPMFRRGAGENVCKIFYLLWTFPSPQILLWYLPKGYQPKAEIISYCCYLLLI